MHLRLVRELQAIRGKVATRWQRGLLGALPGDYAKQSTGGATGPA